MVKDLYCLSMPKRALGRSELCPGPRAACGGTGLAASMAQEEEQIFHWGCSHTMRSWLQGMNGGIPRRQR